MIKPVHLTILVAPRERFSDAFQTLEPEVCDLTRMARLAQLQLGKAVGNLPFADGKYTEPPEAEATGLAVLVVGQMADMAKRLEELYYRLHNEAVRAEEADRAA
jgi:hypothetical protein